MVEEENKCICVQYTGAEFWFYHRKDWKNITQGRGSFLCLLCARESKMKILFCVVKRAGKSMHFLDEHTAELFAIIVL